jgi:hypothetical protein
MSSIDQNIKLPSNQKFGYFFTLVFTIIAIYFYFKEINILFYTSGVISVFLFLITSFRANILKPLNKLWMKFGLILGKIINPIVMGIIYFFIFSPIGILMRLFGRDELGLRLKNKKTYWIKRNKELQTNSFKKQF